MGAAQSNKLKGSLLVTVWFVTLIYRSRHRISLVPDKGPQHNEDYHYKHLFYLCVGLPQYDRFYGLSL
jgi:hypothetical protein